MVVFRLFLCWQSGVVFFIWFKGFGPFLTMNISQRVESTSYFSPNTKGLSQLAKLVSIDVGEIGVGGAKDFFQAKIHMANRSNKFEEEVRLDRRFG